PQPGETSYLHLRRLRKRIRLEMVFRCMRGSQESVFPEILRLAAMIWRADPGGSLITPKTSARAPQTAGDHVAALMASFLGWTLDAFDFFLVIFCLTAIGKEFGEPDKAIALSVTITLAFRPVGAFIFGLLADRYGRRIPMVINLLFYSFAEVATGFAPNYATFMVLRAIFGIGMGGNWGVGASLAMEKVPPR